MSTPPNREARKKCWAARDSYFECLEKHGLWLDGFRPKDYQEILSINPSQIKVASQNDRSLSKEDRKTLFACHSQKEIFDQSCLASWVSKKN